MPKRRHHEPPSRRGQPSAPASSGTPWLMLGFGALAVLAAAAVFFWPQGQAPAVPGLAAGPGGRLVATQPVVDLGRVPFDKVVEARYELANTGTRPVRLVGKPTIRTLEGC